MGGYIARAVFAKDLANTRSVASCVQTAIQSNFGVSPAEMRTIVGACRTTGASVEVSSDLALFTSTITSPPSPAATVPRIVMTLNREGVMTTCMPTGYVNVPQSLACPGTPTP